MSANMSGNCTLFVDNQHYCRVLSAIKTTVASFSLIASLFVIFLIWLFKKFKHFVQRLILALSIAACVDSIGYLLLGVPPENNTLCNFQGWLLHFSGFSVLSWVCCITFNLYWSAIKGVKTDRFERYYHLVSWGIPFVVACLPLIQDHYGPAGAWCWISNESDNSAIWRFTTFYIPMYVCICGLFVVYTYIFVTIRKQVKRWEGTYSTDAERSKGWERSTFMLILSKYRIILIKALLKQDIKPLIGYPFVYLVTTICPLVHRIYNATHPQPNFPLLLLQVVFSPLVGVLNATVFGMDKETLSRLSWTQIKIAFMQHSTSRKPLVREYPVGETTEVRPNDDSSWSASSNEFPSPPPPNPDAEQLPPPPPPASVAVDTTPDPPAKNAS